VRLTQVPLEALKVARSAASDRVEMVCQAAAALLEALATHCAGALWTGGGAGWEMAVTAAAHGTQVSEHTHSPCVTLLSSFLVLAIRTPLTRRESRERRKTASNYLHDNISSKHTPHRSFSCLLFHGATALYQYGKPLIPSRSTLTRNWPWPIPS
jgi:hypothetical protein